MLAIVDRLEGAGHEAWCVGGAVRDALLGIPSADFDIATSARPEQVQQLFRRTVPIGLRFGTVGVLDADGTLHEVTTFRADVETDGRHAVVAFGVALDDDLARRDFTINAIAWHPRRGVWHDPFDGRGDLARRVLRAVGTPSQRFREDYLRILRAVRFAARFGFPMEAGTFSAAQALAPGTAQLSAERVLDEWRKGLAMTPELADLVRLWHAVGAAPVWLPELHAPEAVAALRLPPPGEARDLVRLTAALTRDPAAVLRRLKAPAAAIARAARLQRGPAEPASTAPADVRRWMAQLEDGVDDAVAVAGWRGAAAWAPLVAAVRARGEATTVRQLAVSGTDLLTAGVPAGPALGRVLQALLDAVLEAPELNTRTALLRRAGELAR